MNEPVPAASQWVLRVRSGVLLDVPLRPEPNARCWAGVVWPDPRAPGGWARQLWPPGSWGRGWQANGATPGDVVEFGADVEVGARRGRPRFVPARWYGVVLATAPDHVVAQGPYPDPSTAWEAAQEALGAWRKARQLAAPAVAGENLGPDLTPLVPRGGVDVRSAAGATRVDDPVHGALFADPAQIADALRLDREQLVGVVREHRPSVRLTGSEPLATLAALAAPHVPAVDRRPSRGSGVSFVGAADGAIEVLDPTRGRRNLRPSRHWTPDGFSWGYVGAGPTETAYALLAEATGSSTMARRLAPRYAADVIATIPQGQAWSLPASAVSQWADLAVAPPRLDRLAADHGVAAPGLERCAEAEVGL